MKFPQGVAFVMAVVWALYGIFVMFAGRSDLMPLAVCMSSIFLSAGLIATAIYEAGKR